MVAEAELLVRASMVGLWWQMLRPTAQGLFLSASPSLINKQCVPQHRVLLSPETFLSEEHAILYVAPTLESTDEMPFV